MWYDVGCTWDEQCRSIRLQSFTGEISTFHHGL
jgi:hypothetical protein